MKKIKFFALIGIITISFMLGGISGFVFCKTTPTAAAAPIVTNVQNTQSSISTQTVYVDGQRYIVFTSGSSSMAVVKK